MLGSELIFISRIKRDGSGVEKVEQPDPDSFLGKTNFNMNSLSITNGTYIACEFNSYVVKIKPKS